MAFLLLGLVGLISLLGFSFFCRYPSRKAPIATRNDHSTSLLRNGRYFAALFSFGLPFGIVISYLAVGPYILQQYYALPIHMVHIGFGMTTFVYLLGALFFRARSASMTPITALYVGTIISLVGAAALFLCATIWPHEAWLGVLALCLLLGGAGIIVPAGKAATMLELCGHGSVDDEVCSKRLRVDGLRLCRSAVFCAEYPTPIVIVPRCCIAGMFGRGLTETSVAGESS